MHRAAARLLVTFLAGAVLATALGACGGSATAPDQATAERWFAALSEGGAVLMPLAKTFWSPCFGMVRDRFGVMWMINREG